MLLIILLLIIVIFMLKIMNISEYVLINENILIQI